MDNSDIPITISEIPPRRQSSGLSYFTKITDRSNSQISESSSQSQVAKTATSPATTKSFTQTFIEKWVTVTTSQQSFENQDDGTQDSLPPWASPRRLSQQQRNSLSFDSFPPPIKEEVEEEEEKAQFDLDDDDSECSLPMISDRQVNISISDEYSIMAKVENVPLPPEDDLEIYITPLPELPHEAYLPEVAPAESYSFFDKSNNRKNHDDDDTDSQATIPYNPSEDSQATASYSPNDDSQVTAPYNPNDDTQATLLYNYNDDSQATVQYDPNSDSQATAPYDPDDSSDSSPYRFYSPLNDDTLPPISSPPPQEEQTPESDTDLIEDLTPSPEVANHIVNESHDDPIEHFTPSPPPSSSSKRQFDDPIESFEDENEVESLAKMQKLNTDAVTRILTPVSAVATTTTEIIKLVRPEKRQLRSSTLKKPTTIDDYFLFTAAAAKDEEELDIGRDSVIPSFYCSNEDVKKEDTKSNKDNKPSIKDTRRRPRLGLSKKV